MGRKKRAKRAFPMFFFSPFFFNGDFSTCPLHSHFLKGRFFYLPSTCIFFSGSPCFFENYSFCAPLCRPFFLCAKPFFSQYSFVNFLKLIQGEFLNMIPILKSDKKKTQFLQKCKNWHNAITSYIRYFGSWKWSEMCLFLAFFWYSTFFWRAIIFPRPLDTFFFSSPFFNPRVFFQGALFSPYFFFSSWIE